MLCISYGKSFTPSSLFLSSCTALRKDDARVQRYLNIEFVYVTKRAKRRERGTSLSRFSSHCYVTMLVTAHSLSFCLPAVVLTELRLDVNFLLQFFSHHLQSGGKPMGMNYSKARLSSAGQKSDSAEITEYMALQPEKILTYWREQMRKDEEGKKKGQMSGW